MKVLNGITTTAVAFLALTSFSSAQEVAEKGLK
jgi:hypothetical protein